MLEDVENAHITVRLLQQWPLGGSNIDILSGELWILFPLPLHCPKLTLLA